MGSWVDFIKTGSTRRTTNKGEGCKALVKEYISIAEANKAVPVVPKVWNTTQKTINMLLDKATSLKPAEGVEPSKELLEVASILDSFKEQYPLTFQKIVDTDRASNIGFFAYSPAIHFIIDAMETAGEGRAASAWITRAKAFVGME